MNTRSPYADIEVPEISRPRFVLDRADEPGVTDVTGPGMVNPPGTSGGGTDGSVGQMDQVFHELHAEGCHVLCGVCDGQCWPPAAKATGDLWR